MHTSALIIAELLRYLPGGRAQPSRRKRLVDAFEFAFPPPKLELKLPLLLLCSELSHLGQPEHRERELRLVISKLGGGEFWRYIDLLERIRAVRR
jgi:hypothetical protein